MPTLIETLSLELQLDPRQFEAGLKSVVEKVKVSRDDYERHARAFESVAASLFRAITPLITAIIGIGTALEAVNWSQHASAATTEFTNLADVIGMNVEKLAAWRQAAEAAGRGGGDALVQSFARQQQTMLTMLPGGTGLKDYEFLRALQRYGMADVSRYLDEKGNLDMDRFNRDLASASERTDKNNAERMQWMQRLYISNPAQLSLYKNRAELETALKYQTEVVGVIDKKNTDAMKQLHADWSNLGTAAENLRIQILTNLAEPLHKALNDLQEILKYLTTWRPPAWVTWGVEHGLVPPWWDLNATPPSGVPGQVGAAPSAPTYGTPPAVESTPGGAGMVGPRTGRRSVPSVPLVPAVPEEIPAVPESLVTTPGGAVMVPPRTGVRPSVPAVPGPSGALDLPTYAMNLDRSNSAALRSSSVQNSSVTIGAMTFNSHTMGTDIEHAPSGSERTLSIGQYAVLANTSLL